MTKRRYNMKNTITKSEPYFVHFPGKSIKSFPDEAGYAQRFDQCTLPPWLEIITYTTADTKAILIDQCKTMGVPITILGGDMTRTQWAIKGNTNKIFLLADYIKKAKEYVMVVDSVDVLICRDLRDIPKPESVTTSGEAWLAHHTAQFDGYSFSSLSAEQEVAAFRGWQLNGAADGSRWPYMNTGMIYGKSDEIAVLLIEACAEAERALPHLARQKQDQSVWMWLHFQGRDIDIDSRCEYMQNLCRVTDCEKNVMTVIPRMLHQVWMGNNPPRPELQSWESCGIDRKLWSDAECESIVREYGMGAVWDRLAGNCYEWPGKTDMARLAILHKHGGIYIDADMERVRDIPLHYFYHDFWSVYEHERLRPGLICNSAIGAVPGHKTLETAMDMIRALPPSKKLHWKTLGPGNITDAIRLCGGHVYPSETFMPGHFDDDEIRDTDETIAHHHWGTTTERLDVEMIVSIFPPRDLKYLKTLRREMKTRAPGIRIKAVAPKGAYPDAGLLEIETHGESFPKCLLYNAAAAMSKARYLLFHDVDLIPPQGFDRSAKSCIDAGVKACSMAGAIHKLTSDQANEVFCGLSPVTYDKQKETAGRTYIASRHAGGSFLIDRMEFMRIGGWDERFTEWGHEDHELAARVKSMIDPGWWEKGPKLVLYHMSHPKADKSSEKSQRKYVNESAKYAAVVGDLIGKGVSRQVYQHKQNPEAVVKINTKTEGFNCNQIEWDVWMLASQNRCADMLVPCIEISKDGKYLLQKAGIDRRTHEGKCTAPESIPDWLIGGDRECRGNWVLIDGQAKCCDYGQSPDVLRRLQWHINRVKFIDAVYVYKGTDPTDLRQSIETLTRHAIGLRRIYCIGDDPALDMPGFAIIHIPHENNADNADANIIEKVMTACKDERITDPFLRMSDDYFFMQDAEIARLPVACKGELDPSGKGLYGNRVTATIEECKRRCISSMDYETHRPILIHKSVYIAAYKCAPNNVLANTLYGNLLPDKAQVDDAKEIMRNIQTTSDAKGQPFLSGYDGMANDARLVVGGVPDVIVKPKPRMRRKGDR